MKLYKYKDYVNGYVSKPINESKQSEKEIHSICRKYDIKNYTIRKDGTVKNLTKIPLKFGRFNCSHNQLTSLEGAPKEVALFSCSNNKLTSLKGCPKTHYLYCDSNELTSLEGSPEKVNSIDCAYNKLTNFEGGPKEVRHFYNFMFNDINNFKGFPENFSDTLSSLSNPVDIILRQFEEDRKSYIPELMNEYDVIRDGNKIVLQALELVYDDLGLDPYDYLQTDIEKLGIYDII